LEIARKEKQSTNSSGRNSQGSRKRRKAIASAAFEDPNDDSEATFGANDDDWQVYRDMDLLHEELDTTKEKKAIEQIEKKLKKYGDTIEEESKVPGGEYQMYMGVDRFRVPELLFQPSLLGFDFMSPTELSLYLLSSIPSLPPLSSIKVFLCGGTVQVPNFRERVYAEMRMGIEESKKVEVEQASDGMLDTWRGMRSYSLSHSYPLSSLSKLDYLEHGPHFFVEHALSNPYIPTPSLA